VEVVEEPTRETSVADILMGAVGFVGFVLIAAAVVGLLAGAVFVYFKHLRPRARDEATFAKVARLNLSTPEPPAPPASLPR
jgi:hypothetical protein